jgi:endonuclease/exonuclease/phosphatase family metal-dependent hydrolase
MNYVQRVALASLPFLVLYKPIGKPLSCALGAMRSFSDGLELKVAFKKRDIKAFAKSGVQTALSGASLCGTLFAHPLGMAIATLQDAAIDGAKIARSLYNKEFREAGKSSIYVINHSLYLALLFHGGVEVAVCFLAMQVLIGGAKSISEYRKGRYLEAGGHLLMGMVRGRQLLNEAALIQFKGNIFHTLAYFLQKPVQTSSEYVIRAACGKNRSLPSRCATVALHALSATLTVPLYLIGEGLHFCGNKINGTPYTYWRGSAAEKEDTGALKCISFNVCMLWGGMPILFGGCTPARERMDEMAKFIKEQNPDVLFLQEASFPAAYELFSRLQGDYAHCFTRIGPNPFRMESGLTVFSKVAIEKAAFLPFHDQAGIYRGAFSIETHSKNFITTHLDSGQAEEKRREEFDRLCQWIKEWHKPSFVMGDFNIDRLSKSGEYEQTIGSHKELHNLHNRLEESCREDHPEMVDHAFSYNNKEFNTQTAFVDTYPLSDHKALVVDIS